MTGGTKKRVLSGMRPTGRLHIGHYFGALVNWVKLQEEPDNECFYFIADWHALTSDYADTSAVAQNTIEIATDYLAAGLDPKKCVIFLQSLVPEHAELHLLLSMVTPLGWLERVPTYKEALDNIHDKDLHTYGFLGYPVLQTADIVMYGEEGKSLVVPVGEDQVSHVELSREIVRRFKLACADLDLSRITDDAHLFGIATSCGMFSKAGFEITPAATGSFADKKALLKRAFRSSSLQERGYYLANSSGELVLEAKELLTEPEVLLTKTPRIPGTDGRKMSKSYRNDISLSESDEGIWEKVRPMKTDPARQRRTDKGNPDICPVYDWHKLFSPQKTLDWSAHGCRTAEIGCIECKRAMADNLVKWIEPIRERRFYYEDKKKLVRQIIRDGSVEARKVALKTMIRVRDAVFGKTRMLRPRLHPVKKSVRRARSG